MSDLIKFSICGLLLVLLTACGGGGGGGGGGSDMTSTAITPSNTPATSTSTTPAASTSTPTTSTGTTTPAATTPTPVTPAPAAPTTAVLKLSTTGTLPANTGIAGIGCTITLPANVTPGLVNGAVASNVLSTTGTFAGGTQTSPVYSVANATLQLVLANAIAAGVTQVGEVATVTLQLANSASPTAASFALSGIKVIDTLGNTINGMSVSVSSVTLQ